MPVRSILLVVAIWFSTVAQAQDAGSAHLTWTVDQLTDLLTQDTSAYQCQFETRGQQVVKWKQKGGARITNLSVTAINGNWSDVNTPGELVFNFLLEGDTGSLAAGRNAQGLYLVLQLQTGGQTVLHHRYRVTSVQLN